ncbi:MAG: ABC transporter permease, partial [Ginsengibacter sp.]
MLQLLLKKLLYGLLVLAGVVVIVFFIFQAFADPARLIVGQTGDKKTMDNIRKELYLDQPKWKQFLLYINDVSPVAIHSENEIEDKKLHGFFIGGDKKLAFKIPYLRRSYQTKKDVIDVLMEALPGTLLLAFAAMIFATIAGIFLGVLAAVKKNTWLDTSSVFASVIGISAPSFFMAIVIGYLFGIVLHSYTGLAFT